MASRVLTRREASAIKKWQPLVEDLGTDRDKANLALILDNQENYFKGKLLSEDVMGEVSAMLQEAGGTASVAVDPNLTGIYRMRKNVIPMVRRTFPELITNQVVGVQPMSTPVGLAYAMRYTYQNAGTTATSGTEAGYNTVDRTYSGPYTTANAERLNAPNFEGGSSGNMREMGLRIACQAIVARSRKLKARWSLEAEQDLQAMHALSVEDNMTDLLAYQLSAEIDQEVLYYLQQLAMAGGVYAWTYIQGGGAGADGRWEQEIFRTFYTKLVVASNQIATATRKGAGNIVIASPNVCAMLESLMVLNVSPVDGNIDTSIVGTAKVGRIGRFDVYRDSFATGNYAMVAYKGADDSESGLVFCPYVPVMFASGVGEENFQPRIGAMTRYGLADNLLGATNYYRYVDVTLSGAMGSWTADTSGSSAIPYTEDCCVDGP